MFIQPTAPSPTGEQADGDAIVSNAFWPVIDPAAARAAMRLDGTVTPQRLRSALIEAIVTVGAQLSEWRRDRQADGCATLAEVPAELVDDESVLVQRWRRAVQCLTAANLAERYRSFDSTLVGHQHADALDATVDELRRDGQWAIRDILGIGRSTIELI